MDQPVFILPNAVASYIGRRRSNNNRAAIVCHLLVTAMAIPVALVPCAFRKLYPDVMVMQPGQDWDCDNGTGPLDRPTQGRVFA